MPKLSIIISAYNHQKFIAKCLNSILEQTFRDFEVLIFDDVSSDGTWEIIKSYQDKRIKAFRAEYNRGMVLNINEAIGLSEGEYIAHINSDDYWEENKLAKQLAFLEQNPEYGAVFTGVTIVNEENQAIDNVNYPYF